MAEVMTMFETETQVMQAEACFDMALTRVNKKFGADKVTDSFREKLWNSIALTIVKDGFEPAKDYARNALFVL